VNPWLIQLPLGLKPIWEIDAPDKHES